LIAPLAKLALSNGSLRSLRCSPEAAVFVGSDETIVSENRLFLEAFRRLLLQIGGANIASADRALLPPTSSSFAEERAPPLIPSRHGGARSGFGVSAVPSVIIS
jgi:hypothetical protein